MREQKFTVLKIVNGEQCIVRGQNSEVLLNVPRGIHGVILANVHTNNARFTRHIPKNDCLVSPVCEYHLLAFLYKPNLKVGRYQIDIPTIVKGNWALPAHITVRYGSLYGGQLIKAKALWEDRFDDQRDVVEYDIQEDHVIIHTSHLCGFVVTTESLNCCAKSANFHIFWITKQIVFVI